jgi:hypothetical protein
VYFSYRTFVFDVFEIPILFLIKKYENINGFSVYRPFSFLWAWLVYQFATREYQRKEEGSYLFFFFTPAILFPLPMCHSIAAHKPLPDGCIGRSAQVLNFFTAFD